MTDMKKNVVFGHFIKLRFFIIFSSFESLAASKNEQVASWHEKKTLFLAILSKFDVLSFLGIFESLAASKIEQVASIHEKKTLFLGNLSKFGVLDHFWHFSDSEKSAFSSENRFKIDCSPRIL